MIIHPWHVRVTFALLTLAALALGAMALAASPAATEPAQTGPMTGEYHGSVELRHVVVGALNSPLVTPTPPPSPTPASPLDMRLELSLHLEQTGTQVGGYVMLDRTLIYPRMTSIPATPTGATPGPGTPRPGATPLPIGPRVTGTFDGTTLRLTSEQYQMLISPSRRLANGYTIAEQRVTRQFSLVGTVQNEGNTLTGEYRETVWGYGQQPSTAIGRFTLDRPVFTQFTADPTRTPGPSPTDGPSLTPTTGPSLTATYTPTSASSPTATHTPTSGPSLTPTSTQTPTMGPTITQTPVGGPSLTPTSGPSLTPTHTPTSEPSLTPTHTLTATPSPTATVASSSHRLYLPLVSRRVSRP